MAGAGSCGRGDVAERGASRAGDGHNGDDPPAASIVQRAAPPPCFTEITETVGIGFVHDAGAEGEYRYEEIMGPGGAMADLDGDGRLDIYLINGHRREGHADRFYRQRPDGTFQDVTEQSGIIPAGYGMGCAIGDYDNDGDRDLYLTNRGPDQLWRNNGDGTFTDVTQEARTDNPLWSVAACFFDYDRDGWLDLCVINYLLDPSGHRCYDLAGRLDYCGPQGLPPAPGRLFHNQGGGRFRDVSMASGIGTLAGPGLGVICADLDGDGWQDIYVANDMEANFLWINRRDGTFQEVALSRGCAVNRHGNPEAGMGVAIGDIDVDGRLDLFVTHLRGETNTLYRMIADGEFVDATETSGLGPSSAPYTGFGVTFADFDHDSDLDALVANGAVKRRSLLASQAPVSDYWKAYAEPNLFYLNDGTGRFQDLSAAAGPICGQAEVSRGLAVGDVDLDGDLDVLLTNDGGPARLYRNDLPKAGRWLIVRAVDPALRRDALGALVTVTAGGRRLQRLVLSSFSYASASEPAAHFGLGEVDGIDEVTVLWPHGLYERFTGVLPDRVVELRCGTGQALPPMPTVGR